MAIPEKAFFKIGEASHLVGVEPYVLRYWQTEFEMLRPVKSKSNQRVYRRRDVELLLEIKRLLYDEGFTIAGARKRLRGAVQRRPSVEGAARGAQARLSRVADKVRREVESILAEVDTDAESAGLSE